MITPVMSERAKSVPGEPPLVTTGTLATTSAMALVVCTLRKTEPEKMAPTGVPIMTA